MKTGKKFELYFLEDFMKFEKKENQKGRNKRHFDIFVPFIDNDGIDFVIRTDNGKTYKEIQVKGRETRPIFKLDTDLKKHQDYWLVLYHETPKGVKRYIFSKEELLITDSNRVSRKLLTNEYSKQDFDKMFK